MGQKGIKAGRAYVELGVDDKMARGLRRAQARLKAFGASVTQIGARLAAIGAIAGAAMLAAAKVFSSVGDQVAKMSKRTGFSVETLSELRFVASQTGTEFGALEKAVAKMQRSIYDANRGLSTQVDAFADLGLAAKDFKGLSPEQQFKLLADHISQVEDPTLKAAIAMSLLGRSGTALLPMFAKGAAGIEELQKKARDLGLTISAETARAAEDFTDTMDVLGKVVKMAAFHIGSALAGSMEKAAKAIREKVIAMTEWIKANKEAIVSAAKWALKIAAVGVALIVVGKIIASVALIMGAFAGIIKIVVLAVHALHAALILLKTAHPIILAISLAVAALGALVTYMVGKRIFGEVSKKINAMKDALAGLNKQQERNRKEMEKAQVVAGLLGKKPGGAPAPAELQRKKTDSDFRRFRTIAELNLRLRLKGYKLEKALLELRHRQAIADAMAAGEKLDVIHKEYRLQMKLLKAGRKVEQARRSPAVGGMFYAAHARGLAGGVINKVADNTRQTARNTKKLLTRASEGGLVFV